MNDNTEAYHISSTGEPARCYAKIQCRLGGEHYPTAEAAKTARLQEQIAELLKALPFPQAEKFKAVANQIWDDGYEQAEEDHHATGFWAQTMRTNPIQDLESTTRKKTVDARRGDQPPACNDCGNTGADVSWLRHPGYLTNQKGPDNTDFSFAYWCESCLQELDSAVVRPFTRPY